MSLSRIEIARSARVKAGHLRFRANQFAASNAVPLYRKLRSIDTPLAERYLFVLAHPRSGSTVLSHVLQSHDDIVGFGEHHQNYVDHADLEALAARNAFFDRSPTKTHTYTLDKIVWNHHDIDDPLLAKPNTRFVFLLREPVATLESYRRMFHDMPTDERRLQSYQARIEGLVSLAERIGDSDRMTFITYDQLTDDTAATLEKLSTWLELDTPIRPDYELNAKSGSQSWGDPSEHIKAGRVIKLERSDVDINLDVIDAAHRVYRLGCEKLQAITAPTNQPAVVPEAR